jgi:hypothetical protein
LLIVDWPPESSVQDLLYQIVILHEVKGLAFRVANSRFFGFASLRLRMTIHENGLMPK